MLSNPNIASLGIVVLLIVLAFFLFPAYEHFKDAQGREVDVDPNAPPKPEWLKSVDPRTGEVEEFNAGFPSDRSYLGDFLPSWFRRVEAFQSTGGLSVNDRITIKTSNGKYIGKQGLQNIPEIFRVAYVSGNKIGLKTADTNKWMTPLFDPPRFEFTAEYPDENPGSWELLTIDPTKLSATPIGTAHGSLKINGSIEYGIPETMFSITKENQQSASNVQLIQPASVPPVNMSSTLGTTPGGTADALSTSRPTPPPTSIVPVAPSTQMTVPPPTFAPMDGVGGMGSEYIKKSSLVPCTCTKHTAGCSVHSGASRSSIIPGDQDVLGGGSTGGGSTGGGSAPTNSVEALSRAENQFNVMRPFSSAFTNDTGGVQGFLNSFSAFTR